MGVKMNFRIITKNHAADTEKGFLAKSTSPPYGRAKALPPASELNVKKDELIRARRRLVKVS